MYEQIAPTISDALTQVKLLYVDGYELDFLSEEYYQLGPNDLKLGSLPWKVTGNYLAFRCYHLSMASIKNMSTSNLKAVGIFSLQPYYIVVNSPNAWKKIDPADYLPMYHFKESGKTAYVNLNLDIEVMHMQDYAGKPCNHDPNYDFDKCLAEEVDR